MFNEEMKTSFLKEKKYSNSTLTRVKILFNNLSVFEQKFKKDLSEFDTIEMEEVVRSFDTPTVRAVNNHLSVLRQYLTFSGKDANVMKMFSSRKTIKPLLSKEKSIFSKEEIMNMALCAENAQDGVILLLVFEGVNHKDKYHELSNLLYKSVDTYKNAICLDNRLIAIDSQTTSLIQRAFNETDYRSINGDVQRKYPLTDSPYILKGLRKKVQASYQLIHQRMNRMSEFYDLKHLNATNISYSGQVNYANLLFEQGFNFKDVLDLVTERFDLAKNTSARHSLKLRIQDNIKELS